MVRRERYPRAARYSAAALIVAVVAAMVGVSAKSAADKFTYS